MSVATRNLLLFLVVAALIVSTGVLQSWNAALAIVNMGLISAVCHFMTISAFRHAEASLLAPLSYLELIGATVIGYLVFGDLPGIRILIGAVLIVAGGLILVQRRRAGAKVASAVH